MRMASASSVKRMTGAMGPKISDWAICMSCDTPVRTVGVKNCFPASCGVPPQATTTPATAASTASFVTFAIALSSINGPISTPGFEPSPTLRLFTLSTSFATKTSCTPSWTSTRLAQTHVWPALRNLEIMRPSIAASRSASSKTMKGALPPSSILTRLTDPAA